MLCMHFDLVHRCVHIQRQHGVTVRTGVSVAAVASKQHVRLCRVHVEHFSVKRRTELQ